MIVFSQFSDDRGTFVVEIDKVIKIERESNIWESMCCVCSGAVFGNFLDVLWVASVFASETLWQSEGQGFLEPEPLDSRAMVAHHVWGPQVLQVYRVFLHRGLRAIQKTTV